MKEAKEPPAAPTSGDQPPSLSPGIATLLRGPNGGSTNPEAQTEAQSQVAEKPGRKRMLRASLVLADLLLFALAARLVFRSHGHFGFIEVALCLAALGLGAWLSCLAIWRGAS